jgi:hypothetical protein
VGQDRPDLADRGKGLGLHHGEQVANTARCVQEKMRRSRKNPVSPDWRRRSPVTIASVNHCEVLLCNELPCRQSSHTNSRCLNATVSHKAARLAGPRGRPRKETRVYGKQVRHRRCSAAPARALLP